MNWTGLSQQCALLGPVHVVVDPPVFGQDLGFEEGVEALGVEVLIAHPTVERLDLGVLPGAARVDEGGPRAVEPAPVGNGVGDELRTVVEADPDRGVALFGEAVQASGDTIGIDGTLHVTGESLPGELIDDV